MPFSPFFFVGFPTAANQRVPKKISPQAQWNEFMTLWVERSQSDRVGWSRGGNETAMLCGSLTFDTAVAVCQCSCFFPAFFRAVEHHGVQPESLSYHSKLIWLLIPCCYLQAQAWAIFLHRGVYSSLGWVIAKRESWAEQDSCSVSKATKFSAERECPSNAGLDS